MYVQTGMNVWWKNDCDLYEEEICLVKYTCLAIQIVIKGMLWNININMTV